VGDDEALWPVHMEKYSGGVEAQSHFALSYSTETRTTCPDCRYSRMPIRLGCVGALRAISSDPRLHPGRVFLYSFFFYWLVSHRCSPVFFHRLCSPPTLLWAMLGELGVLMRLGDWFGVCIPSYPCMEQQFKYTSRVKPP